MLVIKTTTWRCVVQQKGQIEGHTYILTVSSVFLVIREVTGTGFLENKRKTKTKVVNSIIRNIDRSLCNMMDQIRDDAIGQLQSGFKVTSHPRFNVEQRSVQFEPELFKSFSFHSRSLRSEQGEQNTNGQMTRKLCESNWASCQLWNNFYTSNHFVSHFCCFN